MQRQRLARGDQGGGAIVSDLHNALLARHVRGVARMVVGQVTATEHLLLAVGNVEDHVAYPNGGHNTPDHLGSLLSGCGVRRRGGLPIRCGLRRLPLRHARRLIHVVDRLARLIEARAPSGWQVLPLIVLCNEPSAPRCARRC